LNSNCDVAGIFHAGKFSARLKTYFKLGIMEFKCLCHQHKVPRVVCIIGGRCLTFDLKYVSIYIL